MSHLYPCPRILVPPPSRYCITSIQVQKLFSHNDPYRGSYLSRFHLTQIQVEMWVSSPSTPHLISIYTHRFTSSLHPGRVSPQSRSLHLGPIFIQMTSQLQPGHENCISLFHPGNISNQSRSQDVRLTSLQVLRDQHRGPDVLVSLPSTHHQRSNIRAACYLSLYHFHPSSEKCMSVPSRHHP